MAPGSAPSWRAQAPRALLEPLDQKVLAATARQARLLTGAPARIARGISATELARRVGNTIANLSILKNDRAKAVRFSAM